MSEYYEAADNEIDIEHDVKEVTFFVKADDNGRIYLTLSFDQIKKLSDDIESNEPAGGNWITGPDDHGSVYVYFQPRKAGAVKKTIRHKEETNIDYDKDGKLYGIEILGVQAIREGGEQTK